MKLKVSIVGCGQIAEAHIEEIHKLDKATVVGVCDLEILMAEQISKRFGVPSYYNDYARMLDKEKPDVVHITTPPQSHLPLTRQALEAGCHVYVEKPLAMNYQDSKTLIELVEGAGKKLTIGYAYMFDPAVLALRELVQNGILGEPVHIESYFGYNLAGPYGSAIMGNPNHWVHRLPGKLFQNNIDHMLYNVTEFIKDEKPSVSAFGYKKRKESYGDARDQLLDELRVLIYGDGISAFGTFCSHAQPGNHQFRIYGTEATVNLDYPSQSVTVLAPNRIPTSLGRLKPNFDLSWQYFKGGLKNVFRFIRSDFQFFAGFSNLLDRYYDSIIMDTPPPIDYDAILRTNFIMEEIFNQLNQGRSR